MYFESKLTLLFCWPVFFGLLFWPRFSGVEATDYQGRQASGRINQFLKHWSISELPSAQQKDSSKKISILLKTSTSRDLPPEITYDSHYFNILEISK
jgi:hypothetical protein